MSTRLLLVALGFFLAVVTGEIAARVWVAWQWSSERRELLTNHVAVRGMFASHRYLPFVLNPAWPGHNYLGFRGGEITERKAEGTRRLACIGASTTYGIKVSPEEAYPAQLAAMLNESHGPVDVINAGVPGWLSLESLINLQIRVLPLEPDVVVILLGRNDILPQAYANFRPDYSHFRTPEFNYVVSNYGHKLLFRWSHLAMLACTLRGERFGWSERAEHPIYGGIDWRNRPTAEQAITNLEDARRRTTLGRSLEAMVQVCQARGILVCICTMAFRTDKLALDELDHDDRLHTALGRQVDANNDISRAVARQYGTLLAEGASLSEHGDLFVDDCHMLAEGHRRRAELIYRVVAPALPR